MARAKRIDPATRQIMILEAALTLSIKIGYENITRDAVAKRVKISSGLIAFYFPRMQDLRKAIINIAINQQILPILAQGLISGNSQVKKIHPQLKNRVLEYLSQK
jgi:AcrR family transcriptional regulator